MGGSSHSLSEKGFYRYAINGVRRRPQGNGTIPSNFSADARFGTGWPVSRNRPQFEDWTKGWGAERGLVRRLPLRKGFGGPFQAVPTREVSGVMGEMVSLAPGHFAKSKRF
jgi:hypothetical protein